MCFILQAYEYHSHNLKTKLLFPNCAASDILLRFTPHHPLVNEWGLLYKEPRGQGSENPRPLGSKCRSRAASQDESAAAPLEAEATPEPEPPDDDPVEAPDIARAGGEPSSGDQVVRGELPRPFLSPLTEVSPSAKKPTASNLRPSTVNGIRISLCATAHLLFIVRSIAALKRKIEIIFY